MKYIFEWEKMTLVLRMVLISLVIFCLGSGQEFIESQDFIPIRNSDPAASVPQSVNSSGQADMVYDEVMTLISCLIGKSGQVQSDGISSFTEIAGYFAKFVRPESSGKLPVQIESSPSGAEIWIDGKSIGALTPYKKILTKKGNYDIELFLSGYESKKETVYVSSPTSVKMILTPVQPAKPLSNISDLYVFIDSIPEGASIWVDKNYTGKNTPDKIYFNNPGNHTYEIYMSGYESFKGDINISKSETMNITLKPIESAEAAVPETANKSPIPGFPSWHALIIIILAYYSLIMSRRRSG